MHAATNYVALTGAHVWPYTNWVTASTNIQDAVDAAVDGDWVLVSNGEYRTGGAVAPGHMLMNRVCVTNRITLASVFGREATVIVGAPDLFTGDLGSNAVRCVYLTNHAVLTGFTLSNGYTREEGGSYYDPNSQGGGLHGNDGVVISDCFVTCNHAGNWAGGLYVSSGGLYASRVRSNTSLMIGGVALIEGSTMALVEVVANVARISAGGIVCDNASIALDSTIVANTASNAGGGAIVDVDSVMQRCLIAQNRALAIGAVWAISNGTLFDCTIVSNITGGGALSFSSGAGGVASNCYVEYNRANIYGGAGALLNEAGTLLYCVVRSNFTEGTYGWGGGVWISGGGQVINSLITGNRTQSSAINARGGGVYMYAGGMVSNCTISGNIAVGSTYAGTGGGVAIENGGTVSHCFISGNEAWPSSSMLNPARGAGVYVVGGGAVNNCLITGNQAQYRPAYGGGMASPDNSALIANCTIVGNHARDEAGGVDGGQLRNSIVYDNSTYIPLNQNYRGGTYEYCCATPLPGGAGNISNAPLFMADYELAPGSPCIDSGTNAYVTWDTDLAGKPRIVNAIVDMGAYEALPEPAASLLVLCILACKSHIQQRAADEINA